MGQSAKILILGGEAGDHRVAALMDAGYECVAEPEGIDIPEALKASPAALLVSMKNGRGADTVRKIKSSRDGRRMPVAAIDVGKDPEILRACKESGVDDVLEDEAEGAVLEARVRALVRLGGMEEELVRRAATATAFGISVDPDVAGPADTPGGTLLVVGIEEGELETMCPLLSKTGIDFVVEPDPYRARSRIEGSQDESFDGALVYVRDGDMREKCDYFCRAVRNDRRLYDLPLFLVSEPGAFEDHAAAYDQGANVVATAPVNCDFVDTHLHMLLRGRERRFALGRRIAACLGPRTADDIDCIYSADFMHAHMERLGQDTTAGSASSCAILFFVPTVAEVAALYGTQEADMLRHQIANWIAALVRVEDTVARTGTDEFLVLLPHTGLGEADAVRQRVVGVLQQSEFRLTDNVPIGVEAYVQSGVTELQPGDSVEDAVTRASDLLR